MRLLACRIDVTVDCEHLARSLDPMLQHASQSYPVSRLHRIDARRAPGGYRITEDGADRAIEATVESASYALTSRLHSLALEAMPEFTKIHAGSASWRRRRLLVVGPPQAGKTTLMTRLVFEGFSVHGDELALLKDGQVLPYPRRFGVRAGTVPLIPRLAAASDRGSGPLVTDPAALGFEWVIDAAPVAAVFYLEPNHGGPSRLIACPKYLMVQRVMSQSTPPESGRRGWIRDVCAMLGRAVSYTLILGNLDEAVEATREALQRTSSAAMTAEARNG